MPPHPGEEPGTKVVPPKQGTPEYAEWHEPRETWRKAADAFTEAMIANRRAIVAAAVDDLLAIGGKGTPEQRIALLVGIDYLENGHGDPRRSMFAVFGC